MALVTVLGRSGATLRQAELPSQVFERKGRSGVVWESVRCYLANQRQGTAKTKTRSEVSGTGKKPYRQKHTGRARHGSRRSPIFVKGGVVFGPRPRDYGYELPKKLRRQAMALALSARYEEGAVKVMEDFELPQPKTRELVRILTDVGVNGSVLLLAKTVSSELARAGRNLPWLTLLPARQANPYLVLSHDEVLFTEQGLKDLVESMGVEK